MTPPTHSDTLTLLPDGIVRTARRHPHRPAIRMGGEELSYLELDEQSNRIANLLIERGVRHGDRVGLYAHKSLELFAALFGIMKAGAAYVPINPDAPAAYVRHILQDCEIAHLVAGKTTRITSLKLGDEMRMRVVIGVAANEGHLDCLEWSDVQRYDATPPAVDIQSEDLAYIMFTSGSTGRPKGIMHSHRSGLAYGMVAAETFGLEARDRLANHAPLNFDLSLFELFGTVVVGATLVVIPENHARLPASFSQMLSDEGVTVVNAVPYALVQLLDRGAIERRDLSSLRWVVFGGEVFPTEDLRRLMDALPRAGFANVYGPAEVNGVTYYVVPPLPEDAHDSIPIGQLYQGMQALLLDENDNEVDVGEPGELLINSATQMLGYWRDHDLTARSSYETVAPDGIRTPWHRTGDLVYLHEDGLYRFIGRKDRMIKTRGHRVELDEIEAILLRHDEVSEAVAFVVPDGEGSQRIEAAVSLHGGGAGSNASAELRRFAGRLLPKYAVPATIHVVDEVPRTTSGKADRVALAEQSRRS